MIIIKKIDDIGRIAIPKDVRRALRWMGGDEIEIIPKDDGTVVLRAHARDNLDCLENLRNQWEDDAEAQEKILELMEFLENKIE